MEKTQVAIIGAGPAGLSAAIELAQRGCDVVVIDENSRPGGQLFKQIHKFFGSSAHRAGTRGIRIAEDLLTECRSLGVKILLDSAVYALFENNMLGILSAGVKRLLLAEKIILATGADEKALSFPGWTLPGVMGAGALQTMMNVHRVLPGRRMLMIGAGNVGLIVSYQALQAGTEVQAIVEAAPSVGGYGVHAAKVARAGTPILTSTTVKRAIGSERLEAVEITALNGNGEPLKGSERTIYADTVCISVGLTPLAELAWMVGCSFIYVPALGGHIPVHDRNMETSRKGIYVAGDISGIEEASTAMEEGRLAGIAAAQALGLAGRKDSESIKAEIRKHLSALRSGPFGRLRRELKAPFMEMEGLNAERRDI